MNAVKPVTAVVVVYDTIELLPHFLDHYSRLGVERFLIGATASHGVDLFPAAEEMVKNYNAKVYRFEYDRYSTGDKGRMENHMIDDARPGRDDYIMDLDLDEFHEYPAPLAEILLACDAQNIWAIAGRFLDRIARDGSLPPVRTSPSLGEQYPLGCLLTQNVCGGECRKVMLRRARVRLSSAAHHGTESGRLDRWPIGQRSQYVVHHFKWNQHAIRRLSQRLEKSKLHPSYSREIRAFIRHVERHGRIDASSRSLHARECGPLTVGGGEA